jgi:hypothetical protein
MPNNISTIRTAAFAFVIAAGASLAQAAPAEAKSGLAIAQSTQIPGAVLAPGQYVIRELDHLSDRTILEVAAPNGAKVIATFLSFPNARLKGKAGSVRYWTAPQDGNKVLRAWVDPSDGVAREFVYPKAEAVAIAKTATEPVAAIDPDSVPELKGKATLTEDDLKVIQLWSLAMTMVDPATKAKEIRAVKLDVTQPKVASAAPRLPRTATNGPLISLLGLAALLAGASLKLLRRA